MNTLEVYYERGIEKGIERGFEKGVEEGIEKGIERGKIAEVRNLITKLGFSNEQIAEIAEVSIDFVQQVRTSLKKK